MFFCKAFLTLHCLLLLELTTIVTPEEKAVIDLQELLQKVATSCETFQEELKGLKKRTDETVNELQELKAGLAEDRKAVQDLLAKLDVGHCCKPLPRDCSDIFNAGQTKNGVYKIRPAGFSSSESFDVLCDMLTDGGGWTVFQKRGQFGLSKDFFYKTWKEYKNGFGDLNKEFWLGNDRLSTMTSTGRYELRVDLWDLERNNAFAKYKTFLVEDESHQYQLHVGNYSGTAGDSMDYQNRMKFSTKDRDNDRSPLTNCASVHSGAWWFDHCQDSHLNGLNKVGPFSDFRNGIMWYKWKGLAYSLPYAEMKIRPKVI